MRNANQPDRLRTVLAVVLAGLMLSSTTGRAEEAKPAEQKSADAKPAPGHSVHGETFDDGPRQAARKIPGCGKVRLAITAKTPEVQEWFDQGLGQIHGFWYYEAERSFRQAAKLDPDCAMAYWGMALANQNNARRARGFAAEAVKRKDKVSPRERRYIEALAELHPEEKPGDKKPTDEKKAKKDRRDKYIDGLEKLLYEFPEELEAKSLLVVALWWAREDDLPITSHLAVNALLSEIFATEGAHPSHHYRVHLWDHEKAEKALGSAAVIGQSAPAVAHMWHMSGHIFADLDRFDDAAWQQEAATRVDHAYMITDRILPDQIHNYAHNSEWLIRDLDHTGRVRHGMALALNLIEMPRHPKLNTLDKTSSTAAYGRKRLIELLERNELWPDLLALVQSPWYDTTFADGSRAARKELVEQWRLLGLGSYHTREEAMGDAWVRRLETELTNCRSEITAVKNRPMPPVMDIDPNLKDEAKKQAEAAHKQAQDKRKEAEEKRKEDLRKLETDEKRMVSVIAKLKAVRAFVRSERANALSHLANVEGPDNDKFLEARLLLAVGDRDAALKIVRDEVDSHKHQVRYLANAVWLNAEASDLKAAREYFDKLLPLSSQIELDVPVYARLAPIAANWGLASDWRKPVEAKKDVGDRPPLDSLGPYLWTPPAAPEWTATDAGGAPRSHTEFAGKPKVMLFYLGAGCLHCTEQLQAFRKQQPEYARMGIDLIGLSTDHVADLKASLDKFAPETFPFPLFSDQGLAAFKAFRAHDDFENQPLHGTFLIDAEGRLRWWDIGPEPFMDPGFLRNEAARLLALPGMKTTPAAPVAAKAIDSTPPSETKSQPGS